MEYPSESENINLIGESVWRGRGGGIYGTDPDFCQFYDLYDGALFFVERIYSLLESISYFLLLFLFSYSQKRRANVSSLILGYFLRAIQIDEKYI